MGKIAVIGIGGISHAHIQAYINAGEEIIAICDILEHRMVSAVTKYGLSCKLYTDYEELLKNHSHELDIVDICTPPSLHCEMSVNSLLAKNNTIVEKPMATSVEECKEMLNAEKESGKILSPIAQNRFSDEISILKEILSTGSIGKALLTEVKSNWFRGQYYYDLEWRGTFESEGGGANISQAIHHIDMLIWLKGLPEELCSMMANVNHDNSEVEDLSLTSFKFKDGTLGSLLASTISHGEEQGIQIQGEKASISQPMHIRATNTLYNGFPESENEQQVDTINEFIENRTKLEYQYHEGQIQNVISVINGKEELLVTAQDGANTIEVITAIYKSFFTKNFVKLPILENDEFYTKSGMINAVVAFNQKYRIVEKFDEEIVVGSFGKESI